MWLWGGHLHVVCVDLWTSQWLNEHRDLEDVGFFKARLGTAHRMQVQAVVIEVL